MRYLACCTHGYHLVNRLYTSTYEFQRAAVRAGSRCAPCRTYNSRQLSLSVQQYEQDRVLRPVSYVHLPAFELSKGHRNAPSTHAAAVYGGVTHGMHQVDLFLAKQDKTINMADGELLNWANYAVSLQHPDAITFLAKCFRPMLGIFFS